MATRFYEVTVIASKTVVIEVEDNGDEASQMEASDFAFNEVFSGCDVEVCPLVSCLQFIVLTTLRKHYTVY
jgi:hypothetical protein